MQSDIQIQFTNELDRFIIHAHSDSDSAGCRAHSSQQGTFIIHARRETGESGGEGDCGAWEMSRKFESRGESRRRKGEEQGGKGTHLGGFGWPVGRGTPSETSSF